jgi:hypothetical protein
MAKGGIQKKTKGELSSACIHGNPPLPQHILLASLSLTAASPTAPSLHSRAARRAASPSIDVDKSVKSVRPPQESINERPAVLAAHRGGGVAKKTRKQGRKSVLSTKMRRRQEKSMERAEAVSERTAVRIAKSKGQARSLHTRRKPWEEVNTQFQEAGKKTRKRPGDRAAEDAAVEAFYAETDEVMDDEEEKEGEQAKLAARVAAVQVSEVSAQLASVPLPAPPDEEEIL